MYLTHRLRSDEDISNKDIERLMETNKVPILRAIANKLLKNNDNSDFTESIFTKLLFNNNGDPVIEWLSSYYFKNNPPKDLNNYDLIVKRYKKYLRKQSQKNRWYCSIHVMKGQKYPELTDLIITKLHTPEQIRKEYLILLINNADELFGPNWRDIIERIQNIKDPTIKTILNNKLNKSEVNKTKININLKKNEDRIKGALYGFVFGDIIGSPIEIIGKEEKVRLYGQIENIVDFEYQTLERGEHTDDSELTLILLETILKEKNFNINIFKEKIGELVSNMDLGIEPDRHFSLRTMIAMRKLGLKQSVNYSGNNSTTNGPAIRALPLSILACFENEDNLLENIISCSKLTHNNDTAIEGAYLTAQATKYLLETTDFNKRKFLDYLKDCSISENFRKKITEVEELINKNATYDEAEKIFGTKSNILETLPYALFCFLKTPNNYKETIIGSINIEGDADSIAAIAGSFSGALNGFYAIPKEWINEIKCKSRIEKLFKY